jgi:hypothetical protein
LDLLEQSASGNELTERLEEIRSGFERLHADDTKSATSQFERKVAVKLNEYEPFIYLLSIYYNLEELDDLAHSVNIRMEDVPERGTTIKSQSRSLTEYMIRRGTVEILVKKAAAKRSKVPDFQDLLEDLQ